MAIAALPTVLEMCMQQSFPVDQFEKIVLS